MSDTGKTHFADDDTIDYIAKLETEIQELRAQLAENAEMVRIAKKLMSAYDEALAKTEGN